MKNIKADKLLHIIKKIEWLTMPEGDELGYANSDLLEIIMEVYGLASSTIKKEGKTK